MLLEEGADYNRNHRPIDSREWGLVKETKATVTIFSTHQCTVWLPYHSHSRAFPVCETKFSNRSKFAKTWQILDYFTRNSKKNFTRTAKALRHHEFV